MAPSPPISATSRCSSTSRWWTCSASKRCSDRKARCMAWAHWAARFATCRTDPTRPQTEADLGGRLYTLDHSDGMGTRRARHGQRASGRRQASRCAFVVGYTDDPGFIDYDYIVREPGVSNPQPDFNDPADVAANLRKVKDADTEETLSGRVALLWQLKRYARRQPDVLLPGPAGRRPHGQPRRGDGQRTLCVGDAFPRTQRQDQSPGRARSDLGPGVRRAHLGDRCIEVRRRRASATRPTC